MVPDEPVLTATAGFQQIEVSWPAVDGAERYELWAWDGAWTQLDGGTLTATSHVHDPPDHWQDLLLPGPRRQFRRRHERLVRTGQHHRPYNAQHLRADQLQRGPRQRTGHAHMGGPHQLWPARPSRSYQYRYVEDGGTLR